MAFRSPAIRAVCVTCPTSSHMQTQDVLLSFEGGDMIMRDGATNEQIEHWPIRYLREYSQKGKRVSFEAGRRCPKGQGIFFFDVERTVNFVKAMDNHIDMIEANDKAATAKPVPPPLRSTPGQRPSNSSARQTSSATSSDRRPQLKGRVPPGHSAVGAAPVTYINVDVGELGKEQHTDLNYSMIEPQKKKTGAPRPGSPPSEPAGWKRAAQAFIYEHRFALVGCRRPNRIIICCNRHDEDASARECV